jgi:hypothetical protein
VTVLAVSVEETGMEENDQQDLIQDEDETNPTTGESFDGGLDKVSPDTMTGYGDGI